MGQWQAIGIDHTVAAWDRLKSPWSRETALRQRTSIRCAGAEGAGQKLRSFLRSPRAPFRANSIFAPGEATPTKIRQPTRMRRVTCPLLSQ
jgi:hypothetical protein